jgi:hypothetical protein
VGVKIAVHLLIGVLHGENLIFLGELSQVAFDAVLLNRILIAFVDPQIARVALAKSEEPGNPSIKVCRARHNHSVLFELRPDFGWRLTRTALRPR